MRTASQIDRPDEIPHRELRNRWRIPVRVRGGKVRPDGRGGDRPRIFPVREPGRIIDFDGIETCAREDLGRITRRAIPRRRPAHARAERHERAHVPPQRPFVDTRGHERIEIPPDAGLGCYELF